MSQSAINGAPSDGFLILDSSLKPVYVNSAATQILTFPKNLEREKHLSTFLATRIRSIVSPMVSADVQTPFNEFHSGKRLYLCRSYVVNSTSNGDSHSLVAVLLQRSPKKVISLSEISNKFHLTVREQEVAKHLFEGLTNKEIAVRMDISTNTVKSFLRMIMVKMGVSTRSGILGKAFSSER